MADNSRAINRVFTRKVICDLIENGRIKSGGLFFWAYPENVCARSIA